MQRIAPNARVTDRHTEKHMKNMLIKAEVFACINQFHRTLINLHYVNNAIENEMSGEHLSMTVRSLRYMVLSGWTDEGRRP